MKRMKLIVLAAMLVAVAVPVWFLLRSARTVPSSAPHQVAAPSHVSTATPVSLLAPSAAHGSRIYSVDLTAQASSGDPSENGLDMQLAVTGRLRLSPGPAQDALRTWGAEFELLTLSGQQPDELRAELARPFAIRFEQDGRVRDIGVAPQMHALGVRLARLLAGSLQFVKPETASADAADWSTTEYDMTGQFLAGYRRSDSSHVKKSKLSYQSFSFASTPEAQKLLRLRSARSDGEYEFGVDGTLQRFEGREELGLDFGSKVLNSNASLSLRWSSSSPEPVEVAASGLRWLKLGESLQRVADSRELLRNSALVTDDVHTLAEQIRLGGTGDESKRRESQSLLARKLAQVPSAAKSVLDELRRTPAGEAADLLLSSLLEAETAEGRAAVLEVASGNGFDSDLRRSAMIQLGVDEHASAETVAGLDRLARESRGTELEGPAALALGAAVHGTGDLAEAAGAGEQARETLTKLLADARDPMAQETYIRALGNAGMSESYPAISQYLGSADEQVRAAAYQALRRIPGEEVDAALAAALTGEVPGLVRSSAVSCLHYRELTPTLATAVGTMLLDASGVSTRPSVLAELAQFEQLPPALLPSLSWLAENDPDQQIRAQANALAAQIARG